MRIISFSEHWPKLKQPEFTTFRFPRKDRDWYIGEVVQVYFKNRTPQREKLGIAEIINKETCKIGSAYEHFRPTEAEAIVDGFASLIEMNKWFTKVHGDRIFMQPINKLTLRWKNATH